MWPNVTEVPCARVETELPRFKKSTTEQYFAEGPATRLQDRMLSDDARCTKSISDTRFASLAAARTDTLLPSMKKSTMEAWKTLPIFTVPTSDTDEPNLIVVRREQEDASCA